MSRLRALRDLGLPVNWLTVLQGWVGPGKFARLVDASEVIAHAEDAVARGDASRDVALLAASTEGETDEVERHLRILAAQESSRPEAEDRKWRVLLLKEAVDDLPGDPLYGLLALTAFWERFDYPSDSPHVVQGRGSTLSPAEYYTEDNLRETVERHRRWMERELSALRS